MKRNNALKSFIASCIGMSFFGISFVVMGAVLPDIVAKHELNEVGSSILVTFLPLGLLLGSIGFGPLMDNYGYKHLFVIGAVCISIGLFGLSSLTQLGYLRTSIFLIGLGGGVLNGVTNSLVASVYDDNAKASKLSMLGVFYGAGALLLPFLLNLFSKEFRYDEILKYTSILVALAVPYFAILKFPRPSHRVDFSFSKVINLIKVPALLLFGLILFFQSGIEGLLNNWTTSYLQERGLSKENALLILSFLIVGITASRLLLGYMLIKVRSKNVLIVSYVLLLIGLSVMQITSQLWMGIVSLSLIGIGIAGVFPIMIGRLGALFKELPGTAISIALTFALLGNSILNFLMGHVVENFLMTAFPVYLIVCVLLQIGILIISKKHIIN